MSEIVSIWLKTPIVDEELLVVEKRKFCIAHNLSEGPRDGIGHSG
jgi:hypothetical protein